MPALELIPHDGNPASPDRVVILVHGTFARDAPWTMPDQKLSASLRAMPGSIALYRFNWSGHNRHESRYHAAVALAGELKKVRAGSPGARIDVITHSHGGNVLMYALRKLPEAADTAIFLATPFLHVQPRSKAAVQIGLHLLGLLPIFELARRLWSHGWRVGSVEAFGLLLLAAAALVALSLSGARTRFPGTLLRSAAQIALPRDLRSKRLLILRPVGDEAAGALDTAYFASMISRKLWDGVSLVGRRAWSFLAWIIVVLLALSFLVNRYGSGDGFWGWLDKVVTAGQDGVYGVWILGLALILALGTIFSTILVLAHLAFGWDGAWICLRARISAEDTPPGDQVVRQVSLPEGDGRELDHSRLYNEEAVVGAVVAFLGQPLTGEGLCQTETSARRAEAIQATEKAAVEASRP